MPIKINLLAELQVAEDMRRRDPVKRGIWIGGFLVFVVVAWIGKLQLDVWFEDSRITSIQAHWKSIEANYNAATNSQAKSSEIEHKLSKLDELSTNRFLWGNVLNALQKTSVPNIQLSRIRGEQTLAHEDAKDKKPAGMAERITLQINGKDWNPNSQDYTKYKDVLNDADFFSKRLGKGGGFVIEGDIGGVQADPLDLKRQFITFELGARFPEAIRQ